MAHNYSQIRPVKQSDAAGRPYWQFFRMIPLNADHTRYITYIKCFFQKGSFMLQTVGKVEAFWKMFQAWIFKI